MIPRARKGWISSSSSGKILLTSVVRTTCSWRAKQLTGGRSNAAAVVATVGEGAKETEAAKGLMKLEGI